MKKVFFSLIALFMLTSCTNKNDDISSQDIKQKETHFYVVRHGKTLLNEANRVQGWVDSPLMSEGISITEKLGTGLKEKGITFDFAYSSDLDRAEQTAQLVLKELEQNKLTLHTDEELREVNFGTYEGEKYPVMMDDISKSLGFNNLEAFKASNIYNLKTRTDGMKALDKTGYAEDFNQLQNRMQSALKRIAENVESQGGGNVLLVSHGMAIIAMLTNLTTLDLPEHLANASVTKIKYKDNHFTVETINDTHYLK